MEGGTIDVKNHHIPGHNGAVREDNQEEHEFRIFGDDGDRQYLSTTNPADKGDQYGRHIFIERHVVISCLRVIVTSSEGVQRRRRTRRLKSIVGQQPERRRWSSE